MWMWMPFGPWMITTEELERGDHSELNFLVAAITRNNHLTRSEDLYCYKRDVSALLRGHLHILESLVISWSEGISHQYSTQYSMGH